MTEPRRSSRSRKQVATIYSDALKGTEKKRHQLSTEAKSTAKQRNNRSAAARSKEGKRSRSNADSYRDDHDEEEDLHEEEDSEEGQGSSEDEEDAEEEEEEEDYEPVKVGTSVTPRKRTPPKEKAEVDKSSSRAPRNNKENSGKPRFATSKKKLPALMWNIAKQVLSKENAEDSLFAALLDTYRPDSTQARDSTILLTSLHPSTDRRADCIPYNVKTPPSQASKLEELCRSVTSLYSTDPNAAQCQLLNLIFRSIGCSSSKQLSHDIHTLEDMDNDQWTLVLTDLVEDMLFSHKDIVLLGADPRVASKNSSAIYFETTTAEQQVTREYRRIYGEFWYVFALVALSSDVCSQEDKRVSLGTPSRFDAELVRDIILRVTELVSVGQPDIRAAATLAALQMGHAILDRTLHLSDKLATATRQYDASVKQKKSGQKAESLKIHIDTLKRATEELAELVTGPIVNGIFMHRYRDSHPCIRSLCLASLSKMTCQRPDIFLCDKYLKYFGWLMSDKAECVRYEALGGLLIPFEEANNTDIDTTKLWHVTEKFLPRIADCTLDVCVQVQERAMSMLLNMLRNGFLDEMDDDAIWNQINLRSLSPSTSDAVRRDALYFIMEQLEAFDEDDESIEAEKGKKARHSTGSQTLASTIDSSERRAVLHLDAIASWVAHSLCDGDIPIDEVQIELADLVVFSIRAMPEHRALMTNWGALIRAISEDSVATVDGASAGDRISVAKQRVLVRFLACAARAEVGLVADASFLSNEDTQPATRRTGAKQGRKQYITSSHPHETLSVALLKALPELLVKFRGDVEVLDSLSILPRYLLPSVFSLTQRKQDFSTLLRGLSQIFLQSNDDGVLRNTAISLTHFAEGDHSRIDDVKAALKNIADNLKRRLLKHIGEDQKRGEDDFNQDKNESSDDASSHNDNVDNDVQFSLSVSVRKLYVLSKRIDIAELLGEVQLDEVVFALCEGLHKKLEFSRELMCSEDNNIIFDSLEGILQEGLWFVLCCASWKVKALLDEEGLVGSDMSKLASEADIRSLVATRDNLINICEKCFEICLVQGDSDAAIGSRAAQFVSSVSRAANLVSCDLRTLFPKEWAHSASKNLRSLAISNEGKLIGGSVRCLRSEEDKLRISGDHEKDSILEFLFPLARSLTTNWKGFGNRREAGIALSYLTGFTQETSGVISALSKSFKKTDPVRLLEAHMACLRQLYDEWIDSEPQDIDDDHPSDEQMLEFENAEKAHHEQFVHIEQLSTRLSQSLGVGRLERKLMPAITGFLKEGIRFSFSSDEDGDLILGSRLSFLLLVGKYLSWVKREKSSMREIGDELKMREVNIRAHPEFHEVHDDDLKALASFRDTLGVKTKPTVEDVPTERVVSPGEDGAGSTEQENDASTTPSQAAARSDTGGSSKPLSAASVQSKFSSVRSSLSPLREDQDTEFSDEDSSYSSKKRGRETQSTFEGHSQFTMEEDLHITDDEDSEVIGKLFAGKVKRSKTD